MTSGFEMTLFRRGVEDGFEQLGELLDDRRVGDGARDEQTDGALVSDLVGEDSHERVDIRGVERAVRNQRDSTPLASQLVQ